jgi:hypothetical protein
MAFLYCAICPQEIEANDRPDTGRLCSQRASFFDDRTQSSFAVSKLVDYWVSSRSQIIMIGESHNERARAFFYPWLVENLFEKSEKPFCLILEWSQYRNLNGEVSWPSMGLFI